MHSDGRVGTASAVSAPSGDRAQVPSCAGAVTLFSSWHGIAIVLLGPLALVAIGVLAMADAGVTHMAVVVTVIGAALEAASLFDFPLRCVVGTDGVERRCALRRHKLRWSAVDDLRRAAGPRLRRGASHPGALVAALGHRRYLLVDRAEGPDEYDALVVRVRAWAPEVTVHARRPPDASPPTWLYRRRGRRPA